MNAKKGNGKNLNKHTVWSSIKLGFSFIADAVRTAPPTRIAAALGAALVSAASALSFVLSNEPFTTNPVELLGSFAYYTDLNITNRLASITLFILVSLFTFMIFIAFLFALRKREKEAFKTIEYSLLPCLVWLSGIVLQPQASFDLFWLFLSAALCWFALFAYLRELKNKEHAGSTNITLIAFGLSFFIAPALLVFIKSPLFWELPFFPQPQLALETISLLGIWLEKLQMLPPLLIFLTWLVFPGRKVLIKFTLYPVQILLLLFFCLILPGAFMIDGAFTVFFNSSPAFFFIVLPLFVIGVWDCTRRCFFDGRSPLSPLPFLALLVFVFLQINPIPGYNNNLFESGARLQGFWASFEGWASLFKDVYIPFGLWDYIQYLLAWLFSSQYTAAATTYGTFLFNAFILIIEFFAVSAVLPVGLSFLLCLVAGVGPQSVVLIFTAILLHPRLVKKPAVWIPIWIILSAFTPFFRIPQGTICVVASLPAFIWQALNLFRQNRKTFWKVAGFLGVAAILVTVWPFGKYFWGLLRIFSETARVNSPWAADVWQIDSAPFFEVLLGNAVLAMPLVSLVVAFIIFRHGRQQSRFFVAFFLSSFVMLFIFASISYGFSRTGWVAYLRQSQVLLTILLPMLAGILVYVPSRSIRAACLAVFLCFTPLWPRHIPSPMYFFQTAREFPSLEDINFQDAEGFGLPHLGVGFFPADHLQEEAAVKKVLDTVLAPDETFLDLTMHGLHYFSSQRKMVTEYPIYYVYPGDRPQLRATESLRDNDVRVTLLDPISFDQSPSPLRTYYLYRYALLHGLPLEVTVSKTMLLPPEYFNKLDLIPPDPEQTLQMLDKQFPMTQFSYLPGVWGRGYQEFSKDFTFVRELTADLEQADENRSSIDFDLQPTLRGADAGLLVLNMDMPENYESDVFIRWVNGDLPAENNQIQFKPIRGINIVPLDASPRWLLVDSITEFSVITPSSYPESQSEREKIWHSKPSMPAVTLELQGQLNSSFTPDGRLLAQTIDPKLFYSIPDSLAGQSLLVHIDLTAPPGVDFAQVFYRSAASKFNEIDSESIPITEGMNEIYFTIPAGMSLEDLRFDPGGIEGNYEITAVEAKYTESPINITSAILFQRPHIDDG